MCDLTFNFNHELGLPTGSQDQGESKNLAVFIPDVPNHFFSLALKGIEEMARSYHHQVLIYLTSAASPPGPVIERLLASGRVDGVLLSAPSGSPDFPHLQLLQERGLPLMFFNDVYEDMAAVKVVADDYEGSYRATSHLVQMGCRHIVHVALPQDQLVGRRRLQGYRDALTDCGLLFNDDLVLTAKDHEAKDVSQIQNLLQSRLYIDGIVAATESAVVSSHEACRNVGRAVPRDVKIAGFPPQNSESIPGITPPVDEQATYATGKEAARLLLQALTTNQPVLSVQKPSSDHRFLRLEDNACPSDVAYSSSQKFSAFASRPSIPLNPHNPQVEATDMLGQAS